MNEQLIRVQFVRHNQVVNPRHAREYLVGTSALSIVATQQAARVTRRTQVVP